MPSDVRPFSREPEVEEVEMRAAPGEFTPGEIVAYFTDDPEERAHPLPVQGMVVNVTPDGHVQVLIDKQSVSEKFYGQEGIK